MDVDRYEIPQAPRTPSTSRASSRKPLLPARCKGCGYTFDGLPSPGKCPECGWPFDLDDETTFTRQPPFVRWRFWMPGFVLAVGGGILVSLLLSVVLDSWGFALWLSVPWAVGAALGYRFRASPAAAAVLGGLAGLGLILGMISFSLAGIFCGIILAGIFMVPIGVGLLSGATLRHHLKMSSFDQRSYLPMILLLLMPVPLAIIEGPARPVVIESISTSATINAMPAEVWEHLMFYEEVRHRPPLILRIGLARPLSTTGISRSPGDEKVCIYNRGRITKRIIDVVPGERLAFVIIEQQIGYERDVELKGGSFELRELEGGQTELVLTTNYRPLLSPRFAWRWGERYAMRTLHRHVLEGIAIEAAEMKQIASHADNPHIDHPKRDHARETHEDQHRQAMAHQR